MKGENKTFLLAWLQTTVKHLQIKLLFPYFLRHLKMKQVSALFPEKTYSMLLAHSDLVIFGILAEACGMSNTAHHSLPTWSYPSAETSETSETVQILCSTNDRTWFFSVNCIYIQTCLTLCFAQLSQVQSNSISILVRQVMRGKRGNLEKNQLLRFWSGGNCCTEFEVKAASQENNFLVSNPGAEQ